MFWAFELESVTACKGEEEVLLPPYTQFEVTAPPKPGRGCTEIALRAVTQPLFDGMRSLLVWVDPSGFESGDNLEARVPARLERARSKRTAECGLPCTQL